MAFLRLQGLRQRARCLTRSGSRPQAHSHRGAKQPEQALSSSTHSGRLSLAVYHRLRLRLQPRHKPRGRRQHRDKHRLGRGYQPPGVVLAVDAEAPIRLGQVAGVRGNADVVALAVVVPKD